MFIVMMFAATEKGRIAIKAPAELFAKTFDVKYTIGSIVEISTRNVSIRDTSSTFHDIWTLFAIFSHF